MKIAFILSDAVAVPSNGVVEQAKMWQRGLSKLSHSVDLVDMWQDYSWAEYDAIVYFHFSIYMVDHINQIYKANPNIYVAPVLDPDYSISRLKIYARWGLGKLKLSNHFHSFYSIRSKIKGILVRSEFEKSYLVQGFGFKEELCHIVPISYDIDAKFLNINLPKENFCLHMSLLADTRKNVKRLINAAIKYNITLFLAGKLRNEEELKMLRSWIKGHKNIKYLGYVTQEEKYELMSRAKVFALPSLNEGVGIVALEASQMGCEIVITDIGGPKEYYNNMAEIVNPYKVDEIGLAIKKLLKNKGYQPELKQHITENYSLETCCLKLIKILEQ